jgi:hypothetical protein
MALWRYWNGSVWVDILGSRSAYVASITPITAAQGSITTIVDVTGSSMTPVLVAGHRYRFTAQGLGCKSTVANDIYQVGLVLGGTQYQLFRGACSSTSLEEPSFSISVPVECVTSGATAPGQINAGTVTCKLTIARGAGTGTLTLSAVATAPITFQCEDVT